MSNSPANSASREADMRVRRIIIHAIGAVLLIVLGLFAILLLSHLFNMGIDRDGEWTISLGVAAIYLVLILGAAVVMYLRGLFGLMGFGMLAMLSALAIWLVLIWGGPYDWQTSDRLSFIGAMLTLVSITVLHTGGFACLKPRTAALNGLRWLTVALPWCFTLLVAIAAVMDFGLGIEPWIGLVYMMPFVGLAALVMTLATPSIIRMDRKRWDRARESVAERIKLDLHCPNCGERQNMAVGAGRCAKCRKIINIELEEPRCECGYLLYRLTSPTCPECGREVPEGQRWGNVQNSDVGDRLPQVGDQQTEAADHQPNAHLTSDR